MIRPSVAFWPIAVIRARRVTSDVEGHDGGELARGVSHVLAPSFANFSHSALKS